MLTFLGHPRYLNLGYCISFLRLCQQQVDEVGDVLDGNFAVAIHVGIVKDDAFLIFTQQIVDQVGHILDRNLAVTIHVASLILWCLGEDDGVERGACDLDLCASIIEVGVDKVFPAVDDVVKVCLHRLGLARLQNDGYVDTLYRGTGVAIRVLVEFEREFLIIGHGAVVGDSKSHAELVASNNLVSGIGDVQRTSPRTALGR